MRQMTAPTIEVQSAVEPSMRMIVHASMEWTMSFAAKTLRSSNEQFDTSGCPFEGRLVEEIRRRVRDRPHRSVELARAGRGVDRIPERDLVADDEDALLRACEQRAERVRVAAGRVV